jgi:hypothetical protein
MQGKSAVWRLLFLGKIVIVTFNQDSQFDLYMTK